MSEKKMRRATWPEAIALASVGIAIMLLARWAFGSH